jgi:hypothetical protein
MHGYDCLHSNGRWRVKWRAYRSFGWDKLFGRVIGGRTDHRYNFGERPYSDGGQTHNDHLEFVAGVHMHS